MAIDLACHICSKFRKFKMADVRHLENH